MDFDPNRYGPAVAEILALDGSGNRLMPLAMGRCSSAEAERRLDRTPAVALFPEARAPEAAYSGLYLYLSSLDRSHELSQDIATPDGSFWHGILHRQEPDAGNAAYWFHRVGRHRVFPALLQAAREVVQNLPESGIRFGETWDAVKFIHDCEQARRAPGTPREQAALEIQRAEWQILFDYCARPAGRSYLEESAAF